MKTQFKLIPCALLAIYFTNSFAADPYNPFNTPVCLTSQVKTWDQIPGKETEWAGNYAVQITNNCGAPLTLVATTGTEGVFNVYPLSIQTAVKSDLFEGTLVGSYYIPSNQAIPAGSTMPYFAGAFQLFADGKLVTGSTATATGDAFNSYYDSGATQTSDGAYPTKTNLYWSSAILTSGSWYALVLGTQEPDYVKISLTNTNAPQYNLASLTFTQTADALGLPAGTDFAVILDFSATAFSYLGKYEWHPLDHPVLTIPVSVKTTNDILNLNYTIQAIQAPTAPKGFGWQRCTTTSGTSGTISVDSAAGASFPSLAKFTCTSGSTAIKHAGIEGMPLKIDDGSVDGLFNDINNLNTAETGVIVGFANMLSDDTVELGVYKKDAADIAGWQRNTLDFQDSGHVMLISFGGEASAVSKSIWQWTLAHFTPAPTADQLACNSAAACKIVIDAINQPLSAFNNKTPKQIAIDNYEALIARYKPNGIDLFVLSTDLNPLANEFTAEVLKQVMTDVLAENSHFVLSLSLTPASQATFGTANIALMTALANQSVIPTYVNAIYRQFTNGGATPTGCSGKFVTGTCIVNSLTAYVAEYNAIWPTATIYPGIIPMAPQDYSDTIEIWPANLVMSAHPAQLDGIFSSILTAESADKNAAGFPASVLFSYWNTTYDFLGGYSSKSYPSNQYQLELASYANTPFQAPSLITWNPSALLVTSLDQTSGTVTWSPATDAVPSSTLSYNAVLYLNGTAVSTKIGVTSPATFSNLATGTAYQLILTAKDNKSSIPVWRTTWLMTAGNPTITWTPNLIAQGNPDGISAFANWDCASDSDNTATLAYTVTIDGSGIVGPVDTANCKVNFTKLKVATTYNVTVSVSDNRSGVLPTTSPAKAAFTTTSTAPVILAAPTQSTWDPKPDHTGILTFNDATGGMPNYTYQIIVSPSGAGTSLPFTVLSACPYADCSQVYDNMYRVSGMTFGVTYQVSILAFDAAGQQVGMNMFQIMDSN